MGYKLQRDIALIVAAFLLLTSGLAFTGHFPYQWKDQPANETAIGIAYMNAHPVTVNETAIGIAYMNAHQTTTNKTEITSKTDKTQINKDIRTAIEKASVLVVDGITVDDWRTKKDLLDQTTLSGETLDLQGNSQDKKGAIDWDSYLEFRDWATATYADDTKDETFGSFLIGQVLPTFLRNNPVVYYKNNDGNHYGLLVKTDDLVYKIVDITTTLRDLPDSKDSLKQLATQSSDSASSQTSSGQSSGVQTGNQAKSQVVDTAAATAPKTETQVNTPSNTATDF
jgi:hypothetical protein